MARSHFENLRVYQLAEELADHLWEIVLTWQRLAQNTVGEQMVDAADSIGANIAEGAGRGTYRENRRFVIIARGSLYETKHWLRRAYRRKLLKPEHVNVIKPIVDELAPKLNSYLKSIGTRRKETAPDSTQRPSTDN